MNDSSLKFELDGKQVAVRQQKIFGILFGQSSSNLTRPLCRVRLVDGSHVDIDQIGFDGDSIQLKLVTGPALTLPVDRIQSVDFSLGKVSYLSLMEPQDVKYTPFFEFTWEYGRDHNLDGGPLMMGDRVFRRGLCIHSRTRLRYRLRREYRRFRAVMGIDRLVVPRGDVHVIIRGDDDVLLEADVKGTDDPREIDLDVSGVRFLEILVDYGNDRLDISDHLDLGDARVLK